MEGGYVPGTVTVPGSVSPIQEPLLPPGYTSVQPQQVPSPVYTSVQPQQVPPPVYTSTPPPLPVYQPTYKAPVPQPRPQPIEAKISYVSMIAWIALGLAVIALIMFIILVLVWFFNRRSDSKNPFWTIITGTGTSASIAPDGNDLFIVPTKNSVYTITITSPGANITGRLFIIDNTINSKTAVVVGGSGVSITDSTANSGTVAANTSGAYMWLSQSAITRLA